MGSAEEQSRARRAARRAELRRTHPDLGGSPEAFRSALEQGRPAHAPDVPVVFAPDRLRTAGRRVRVVATGLRTRLPARVPGALRRFEL